MNWDLEAGHVMADHNVVHGKFCSLLIYIGSVRSNRNLGRPGMHFAKELTTCKFLYYQPHDLILNSQN